MDDKLLIALIAAGSTLLGVIVSSAISYILSSRTERLKSYHAAADFLRHKVNVLESLKGELIELGSKRHSLKKVKKNVAGEVAAALEDTFETCSKIIAKGGHFLPAKKRKTLLVKSQHIKKAISIGRAEHYGLKDCASAPCDSANVIDQMYSFIHEVNEVIDDELNASTDRVHELYGIN